MKRLAFGCMAILALASLSLGAPRTQKKGAKGGKGFTGEIMDSDCAKQGSHEAMEKMENLGNDAKACTLKCLEMGSKLVLYDAAKKMIYSLDDQTKPKEFAGQKVKVTGTYDKTTKTIHVESIRALK